MSAVTGSTAIGLRTVEAKCVSMRSLAIVFGATSFLSAFLLFQVQLIVSKHIVPWFGGSAAVWTTSLLVFQVLLLAGYAYSHWISERLSTRQQAKLHIGLLVVTCTIVAVLSFVWPSAITPGSSWKLNGGSPVLNVIAILLVAAGLPFFVLSTTGPLLQHWFAAQGADSRTYRLYSVSNLGSLIGLLSYPFLLEPAMHMTSQGKLWTLLFCAFTLGCAWCAWQVRVGTKDRGEMQSARVLDRTQPRWTLRVLWVLLAACASALLLATTNLLCQEITSIPLLWVLPLCLYLLSFILCFDHPRWYRREIFHPLFAIGVFALCVSMHFALRTAQVIVMPLLLFVACMICHGELVRLKPSVCRLTSFYLAVSAGGALGGLFVAIIAPHMFRFFTEFQLSLAAVLVLILSCLFRDERSWIYRGNYWLPAGIIVGAVVAAYFASEWFSPLETLLEQYRFYPLTLLVAALVLIGAYMQKAAGKSRTKGFRPLQVLVVLIALISAAALYQSAQAEPGLYLGERNFYGALRIYELAQGGKALFHGQTMHGAQLDPPNNHLPMAYYGPDSGIGILLQNLGERSRGVGGLRVGVVGLGAGTLAAYGLPGDYFRYYEINPEIIALSAGPQPVFTYIRDSQAKVDVEQGDARMLLEREASQGQAQNFDVLVLDAFSGDAVPVHLLTTEAFDTYWKQIKAQHGIIAIHVSSRHINLMPVIEGIAQHYNAAVLTRFVNESYPFLDNLWVFLAKDPGDLQIQGLTPNPPPLPGNVQARVWTDDYSDIIRLLY